jgi:methylated-DNA-protein-cysteine methyltransferase-like protein
MSNDFFQDVYAVVRLIPEGRITTYGAIARYLGASRSSRMVGWAMNASHKLHDVPAHRVVNRVGVLTGKYHFPDSEMMQHLLEKEGINVVNDQIACFQKHFWDPSHELTV